MKYAIKKGETNKNWELTGMNHVNTQCIWEATGRLNH